MARRNKSQKIKVAIFGALMKAVTIDPSATEGAVIGEDLWLADGSLFDPSIYALKTELAPAGSVLAVRDEGVNVGSTAALNFIGPAISAAVSGDAVNVTVNISIGDVAGLQDALDDIDAALTALDLRMDDAETDIATLFNTKVQGPAVAVDNHVVFFDGTTGKLVKDSGLTLSGTNTGDQTSIVGITGTLAEFNAALTGADFATGGGTITGTSSGTNTGDQTSIVGITGTLAQFNTAITDADILSTAAAAAAYQPLDAGLTSIAGLTTLADRSIYTTASDTYAVYTLTSLARNLLDDATESAMRSTLLLGTAAVENIATNGANVGRLNADNTYAGDNIFSGTNIFTGGNTMRQTFRNTAAGNSSIGQTAPGIFLSAAQHSTTNKYSPGVWWGSTDVDFTTTNPKLLAGIVGYATESYTADTHGGMGIEFFGSPNGPGTAPTPTSLGTWTVAGGLALATPLPLASGGLGVALTDPGADRIAFWDDSAGNFAWLTLGTNLSITGTTLDASSGSGAMSYIGSATSSAQTTLSISGLDLDADTLYFVQIEVGNATGSALTLSWYYNADTTATNYDIQANTSSGTGDTNGRANSAAFMACAASSTASIHGFITKNPSGTRVSSTWDARIDNTTAINLRRCAHLWRTTSTNVTGATLSSSVASSLNATIRVWKIDV